MDIQEYVVTLCVRRNELSALKELPGTTKDRLRPVLLLAPWLSTVPLARALDKFEEAYPDRPYFVDFDRYYQANDKTNVAKELWGKFSRNPADIDAWWDLLEDYPFANPCLLIASQSIELVRAQIDWARERSRNFCIRLDFAGELSFQMPGWMPVLIAELAEEGANDYAIVLEFGFQPDPLQVAATASGYARNIFSTIPAEVPVVVSCTSFPKDFTTYDGTSTVKFDNRQLIAQVQRETNHPRIVYGDWGSTKPRSYEIASTPRNRVDYPVDNQWIIARDKKGDVDFQVAADRIVKSPYWAGNLGIWGEQLIEGTAAGQNFAIDSMPKMSAARINIHLHRQAHYGNLPPPAALDEEWSDDL